MTYHHKRAVRPSIFMTCYTHDFCAQDCSLGDQYVHRTLDPQVQGLSVACSRSGITVAGLPGRPHAPWQSRRGSIEHLALVLLWTSLVHWTEIPLQRRSARCCFVCSRWKSQWNQELLWISHAETHASLPFRVCKTCHSWKEVRSSEMTCCATSYGGCYRCFVLCPGMVTNLDCPVDYNS